MFQSQNRWKMLSITALFATPSQIVNISATSQNLSLEPLTSSSSKSNSPHVSKVTSREASESKRKEACDASASSFLFASLGLSLSASCSAVDCADSPDVMERLPLKKYL